MFASAPAAGRLNGLLGVIFSALLPATRIAVLSLSPPFVSFARGVTAGVRTLCYLMASRRRLPARTDLGGLTVVAFGVVLGFPLLSALAPRHMTSAHALLFIALLRLSTALFAVLLAQKRPKPIFLAIRNGRRRPGRSVCA